VIKVPERPKIAPVAARGKDGWSRANESGQQLAARIDRGLQRAANLRGESRSTLQSTEGRAIDKSDIFIANPGEFRIHYPYSTRRVSTFDQRILLADGNRVGLKDSGGLKWAGDIAQRPAVGGLDDPVEAWTLEFAHRMFTAVGSERTPVTDLVRAATRKGYRVTAETKTIRLDNTSYPMARLMITAPRAAQWSTEITVDAKTGMPLSVRTEAEPDKTTTIWAVKWYPTREFDTKRFKVPEMP
jgi:outer membrane lipoprotein-sorting protein